MEQTSDLRKAVFSKRPALAKIYREFGHKSIFEYVNSWRLASPKKGSLLVSTIIELTGSLYGQGVANEVSGQLESHPLISTIDHHGILNHPFFINSNLLFSLNDHLKYLVCLSTASVSINNSSWPGCLVYHDEDGKFCKLPVTSSSNGMRSVFAEPAITQIQVEASFKRLEDANLSADKKLLIKSLIERHFTGQIFGLPGFSDQAAMLSFKLWREFFPGAAKVIYLPIEEVVSQILAELLKDPNHLFTLLLTQEPGWALLEKYLDGTEGGFTNAHKGSFLFWGLSGKKRRIHLRREGKKLVGEGGSYDLSPGVLAGYLERREIYPTTLTCFLVLLFYQMTCVGGFNQTTWLAGIKEKFIQLLQDPVFGEKYFGLIEDISTVPTDNFAESPLAFMETPAGRKKATGIDIFLEGNPLAYEKYRSQAAGVSLAESIDSELPKIFPIVFPAATR